MSEWAAVHNGVYLSGGRGTPLAVGCPPLGDPEGCLTEPPDGLGLPSLRTEDVAYLGRDGVRHFADFYEPRILTFNKVIVADPSCSGGCPDVRERAQAILDAFSRQCEDSELVIYTDCHGQGSRSVVGPYGVVGRPRVAQIKWRPGRAKIAEILLRFDAVDAKMYVLDECGTPGSGAVCTTLDTSTQESLRCYDRCYTGGPGGDSWCYVDQPADPGAGPQTVTNTGTVCVYPTITLCGRLTNPVVENLTTGESIGYQGVIAEGECIVINTEDGTATTDDGADRSYLLTGDVNMPLLRGDNELRLVSFASDDTGTAQVCFRPVVLSG